MLAERWLVTGSTGLLGSAVCSAARKQGLSVIGLSRSGGSGSLQFDLCDLNAIPPLLDRLRPAGIFHLAAIARPVDVEREGALAEKINVRATEKIAAWCEEKRAKLVFSSSDWVFDGYRGPYRERDEAHPSTLYGQLKLTGEKITAAAGGVVARLGWVLDDRPFRRADFISKSLIRLKRGESVVAAADEHRTPILRSAAAEHLLRLGSDISLKLLHIAGSEHVTPYEVLRRAAAAESLPIDRILRSSRLDLSPPGRPGDVRLDTTLLRTTHASTLRGQPV